jgi:hypothetical protein
MTARQREDARAGRVLLAPAVVALAVLAAWGLSLWTRGLSVFGRRIRIAAMVLVMTLEYRAFPVQLYDYDPRPVPVYEWLRSVAFSGAVVEWPLGFPHDCEYTLRQAEHEKPLVNGHSSFAPKPYEALHALLRLRPSPDGIWKATTDLQATLLVYHPHETTPLESSPYRHVLQSGLEKGWIVLLGAFPHAADRDFVFRFANAPDFDPGIPPEARLRAAEALNELFSVPESELAPPFGGLHLPKDGQTVAPGFWAFGWVLDDSGIAEVRVGTELGSAGGAQLGGRFPGVAEAFPDYADSAHPGFGFPIPAVPPGPHTLIVDFVARDGGHKVVRCPIIVVEPTPAPATRIPTARVR